MAFAAMWWRARSRWQAAETARDAVRAEAARDAAAAGTAPFSGFLWRRGSDRAEPLGQKPAPNAEAAFESFLATLAAADTARVGAALTALREQATPFSAAISTADRTTYQLEGRPTAIGDAVLWLTDVSAAMRAEEARAAAAAASAELREILDALPLPIWRRDGELRLADCNAAYAAAIDAPRDAALAQAIELAADSGPDRKKSLAHKAAETGAARRHERHVVVGGSRRLLELNETPARAGGTIGFALDRTDLETAESDLSRHVNAHGQVLESIHAAVAIYGPDKRLSFFNSAFAALWGIEEEWLSGEPSLDELLERLRERRRVPEYADFRAFKRQQLGMFTSLIEPVTELMHLPDGRTLSTSVSPHPLGGLIFVYEDVTDRLALESSYNTLIAVQRETLDNLFEGIAVFGSNGRLKLYNPAYRRIWALSEADLAGEPHYGDIVDKNRAFYEAGDEWGVLRDQIVARVTAQAHWSGRLDRSDGSVLQLATVPLPDGDVLVTALDVTDTVRVERALRERNEALETADGLKSEFIANVSYELRTPLNAIIGFAEIMANQYFGPLNPRQLDYARGIIESSDRLMSLINDILDLATIEAGYLALQTSRVEIRDMLEAVMTLARERARSQNLSLTLDCAPGIGAISGDERRLKQAVFNLVSNALKFTPAGGAVRVGARADDDGDVVIAIADTGVGIAAEDQQRVFEKFERAQPHARESGAGLGLSLVKNLIELHGGSVMIESAPGTGTTVACRLPASLRLPAEAAPAEPPAA